jgi:spore coat polysaccharide biosynthesis protein SpsF
MNILAITQARLSSSRLPEKILKKIGEETLLEIHLKRIKKSKLISNIVLATTNEPGIEKVEAIAKKININIFKGSVENVLERFYEAALPFNPDLIVRLTSDCPLIDPEIIDKIIEYAIDTNLDYVSNTLDPTYPDGIDVEVFKYDALKIANIEANLNSEREHVTPYIWKNSTFFGINKFNSNCIKNNIDYSKIRLTVDTIEDYILIQKLIQSKGSDCSWIEYVKELERNPELLSINCKFKRNEGYEKSIKNEQ